MSSLATFTENYGSIPSESKFDSLSYYQDHLLAIKIFNAVQLLSAEAYINGLELPDSTLNWLLRKVVSFAYHKAPFLIIPYQWILTESKQIAEGSEALMEIQYNLPAELFKLMLGEGELLYPKYTTALWEKGASSLEEAQIALLDDLIAKAEIQDGDEILDIGCGFGSAVHYILAKFPNAKVTGLNLSQEHCKYMRQKMQDPSSYLSSERFTLCEADFNQITFDKKFDKIITLGVFEHIGNLTNAFAKTASCLKDDGKFFLHIISTRLPHNISSPFLNKYIFPNARIWSYQSVPNYNQDLKTVKKWFLNGFNYAHTLKAWLTNFDHHQEEIKQLDFKMNYAKFRRLWRLYLMWCIIYFETGNGEILGNGQYLMTHA
jgi:cyclopropane-fatty-acyl-phospholipid synthase